MTFPVGVYRSLVVYLFFRKDIRGPTPITERTDARPAYLDLKRLQMESGTMDSGAGRMNSCEQPMETIDSNLSFTELLSMVALQAENKKIRDVDLCEEHDPFLRFQGGCLTSLRSPAQRFVSEDGVVNARARVLGGGSCLNAGFYTRASGEYVRAAGWDARLVNASYRRE
ncbi:hypothetical protein ACQ4PT_017800 [Festuca glaucescens]